jgi:hypothetical protein
MLPHSNIHYLPIKAEIGLLLEDLLKPISGLGSLTERIRALE